MGVNISTASPQADDNTLEVYAGMWRVAKYKLLGEFTGGASSYTLEDIEAFDAYLIEGKCNTGAAGSILLTFNNVADNAYEYIQLATATLSSVTGQATWSLGQGQTGYTMFSFLLNGVGAKSSTSGGIAYLKAQASTIALRHSNTEQINRLVFTNSNGGNISGKIKVYGVRL
jgi:hypothetical protein